MNRTTYNPQVSISTIGGIYSNTMVRMPLADALKQTIANAPEKKEECWLISNGYSNISTKYTRAEHNFNRIDTILLDVDNPTSDPNLLKDFEREYQEYRYFLWETASSTSERPKFRVIILLDHSIEWINEPQKFTKQAILQTFSKWTDDKASWFFTPTRAKLGTFKCHSGIKYPASKIEFLVNLNKQLNESLKHSTGHDIFNELTATRQTNPDAWRNLPSVKYCLQGLTKGERDISICKACYAMDKNGYGNHIGEFIDELMVPQEFKNKFKSKYHIKW